MANYGAVVGKLCATNQLLWMSNCTRTRAGCASKAWGVHLWMLEIMGWNYDQLGWKYGGCLVDVCGTMGDYGVFMASRFWLRISAC